MEHGAGCGGGPRPVEYTAWLPTPGPAAQGGDGGIPTTRMRQVLQSLKTGEVLVQDVPVPATAERGVLVRAIASVVSAGTERMVVEFAEKNLLQKARARPDLVRQVLQKARREGLLATFDAVTRKLDEPFPLGYSLVGEVIDVGTLAKGVRRGDLVACAGAGIANHAEFAAVPQSLFTVLPPGLRGPGADRGRGLRDAGRDRPARLPSRRHAASVIASR